ncbi:hypothetical protein [Streptomyces sp. CAU 1734]|uniref:hypothetical protein n=1 Tax=Streptomyces sp. CAU 1734 TaxID=3140360 RepID=UPI00326173F6
MTAMLAPDEAPPSLTKVNGLEVIEVEFADTPLSTPDRPVRFKQLELARSAQMLHTELERTTRERDRLTKSLNEEWKPRALAAERQLNNIQRALAPVR